MAILNGGASNGDGIYTVDLDGSGSLPLFQVYCDMTTDGGGWTLVLAYNHLGGQNNGLVLGIPLDPSAGYAHMPNALMQALPSYTSARFFCQTTAHSRVIHFKTSNAGALAYIKNGTTNAASYWNTGFTALSGHTAYLPAATLSASTGRGDLAMTYLPFYRKSPAYTWEIQGIFDRWSCDDSSGPSNTTLHQVWVR